jgi:SAM-dependent methyltransferase
MALEKTNLENIDIAKLYKEQKNYSTFKGKSSEDWDKRAKGMNQNVHKSIYTKKFTQIIDTSGCESLLDVGCGPGTIALAMAEKLKQIYALDYSNGMLECVKENCTNHGICNIIPIQKSWQCDWGDVPQADIVVASRSMEVDNIEEALEKLNSKAKKRVYITTKVGGSFIDTVILDQLERKVYPRPDYIYLVNLLHTMGIYAKVDFIPSENSKFVSEDDEEFIKKVEWSLGELSVEEKMKLKEFFHITYKKIQDDDFMNWALIYWDKP